MGNLLVANGIDARTGLPLLTVDEDDLVDRVLDAVRTGADRVPERDDLVPPDRALPFDVRPTDVASAGWSIVFAITEDSAVMNALAPLIEHRRQGDAPENVHVHEYHPGESVVDWLARHQVNPGIVDPSRVGYYVLLVGSPADIPFDFQFLLDVEYAVGRLHLGTPAEYARYVEGVLESETSAPLRDRVAAFWGPRHDGDAATALSAGRLLAPLAGGPDTRPGNLPGARPGMVQRQGYRASAAIGAEATRERLLAILAGADGDAGSPGLLFTAGHGVGGLPAGDPEQRRMHGALVTQDWVPGTLAPDAILSGDDVDGARVAGMVAFIFACYGAGTPAFDAFPAALGSPPVPIADEPFVAHLPQALLAHPFGPALACIGHVERAWGYSISSRGGSQLRRFEDIVGQILAGFPVGHAMRVLGDTYAVLSTALSQHAGTGDLLDQGRRRRLLDLWMERTDAQNYVVLGDPAVHLPAAP